MRLYVDGEPVTFPRSALSAIGPVGPKGVTIGNGLDGGTIFGGDIDEAKVWRCDPNAWRATFLDRPQSPAGIECWERVFRALERRWRPTRIVRSGSPRASAARSTISAGPSPRKGPRRASASPRFARSSPIYGAPAGSTARR